MQSVTDFLKWKESLERDEGNCYLNLEEGVE